MNGCECTIVSLLVALHGDCTIGDDETPFFCAHCYLASSFRSRSMTDGSNLMKIVVRYGRLGCGVECAVTRAGCGAVKQLRQANTLSHRRT